MSATPTNPWSANPNDGNRPPPSPPQRPGGMPVWGWVLLGCFGSSFFVIAILAAILFPVFAQAREKARQVSCMSNQKQIGLALLMYSEDNDEILPAADKWMDLTEPYISGEKSTIQDKIYCCPSVRSKDPKGFGYAYNDAMSRKKTPKVDGPNLTPLLYDSSTLTRNAHDAVKSLTVPGRHSGGNNVVYADGNARYKKDGRPPYGIP